MPISTLSGQDIFRTRCQILVNTINCVGVMGAGIAAGVKSRHLDIFHQYKISCSKGEIVPGKIIIYPITQKGYSYEYICNFPTKRDWRNNSLLEDIELGLDNLNKILLENTQYSSIAIPKLGCGLGGLNWMTVKNMIFKKLWDLPQIIQIYE